MARKLVEIPRDATLQAKEVVRAISRCGRGYTIQVPQAFKAEGINYTVYAFTAADWLGYHSVKKALARINFGRENIGAYWPLVFLQNFDDVEQISQMSVFRRKVMEFAGNPAKFMYSFEDARELIAREELMGLPANDENYGDNEGLQARLKEVKHIREIGHF